MYNNKSRALSANQTNTSSQVDTGKELCLYYILRRPSKRNNKNVYKVLVKVTIK